MRTVQKTQSVRAIFTPKAKINNKDEQKPEKELKRYVGRISGATENTAQTEKLSIFAGSKIKQVKESGS